MPCSEVDFIHISTQVQAFVVANFLLFGFCGALIFAFAYPYGGKLFYSYEAGEYHIVELLNNILVFFISGLTLKVEDLNEVVRHKIPVVYSVITINMVTTLLSFGLIRLPYLAKGFTIGMTIFATVPTTLGTGVALTQLAKGDQTLSLFLTVVSNLLGIFTIPFFLSIYFDHVSDIHIDSVKLALKLAITVLMPTVVGMLIRRLASSTAEFTKTYRSQLSMLSTFNLVMITWMALSSARNTLLKQNIGQILAVVAVAVAQHVIYLCWNAAMVSRRLLNIPTKQAVSVIIMASQKSSPVALAVIAGLAVDTQQRGLCVLPCIIGQLAQIFVGSFLVPRLAAWVDCQEEHAHPAEPEEEGGVEEGSDVELGELKPVPVPVPEPEPVHQEVEGLKDQ